MCIRDRDYAPRSYYEGATPENDYQPSVPYSIVIIETPYSRDNESQGYLKLYVKSGGADSPRPIELRQKKSTGEWFLTQQMLLGGDVYKRQVRAPGLAGWRGSESRYNDGALILIFTEGK